MKTQVLARALILAGALAVQARAGQVDAAFMDSAKKQQPLIAIGSSEYCQPCRQLKAMLDEPDIKKLLSKCVVLKIDSQSPEYFNLTSRFPIDASKIPMLYVVLPDGNLLYGAVGKPTHSQLVHLISESLRYSQPTPAVTTGLVDAGAMLTKAREHARNGELIQAIRMVEPVMAINDASPQCLRARKYQDKLESAIIAWLGELDEQIHDQKAVHGARSIESPKFMSIFPTSRRFGRLLVVC